MTTHFMSQYTQEVFNMLGLYPEEEFKIDIFENDVFKLTEDLELKYRKIDETSWSGNTFLTLRHLITQRYEKVPIKIIDKNLQKLQQVYIQYLKAHGYKYLAKNSNHKIIAFKQEPIKSQKVWKPIQGSKPMDTKHIEIPMEFISWYHDKPYYIGD